MEKLFRTRLIEERKHRKWSQQEVADRIGTTQNNISRWELGLTTPSPYFRAKLCELFGKSAQELGLLFEQGSEEQPPAQALLPAVDHLQPLWHVPHPRNPYFTGRGELLDQLDQHLSCEPRGDPTTTQRAALTQPQAIKGLGGIGKTQLAVEYAYRSREQGRYTHIFWINADSAEAIMTSFVTLAELLPVFPAQNEADRRKLVAASKRWLEQCPQPWLLIFDNADDLSLVQEYLPQQGKGSILLTTRANAVGSLAASIEVEVMGFMEGTQLLLRRAQRFAHASDEEINEAGNIVVALDHFPLALDQAGAYIEETGCNYTTYLQLYQNHRKALLARRGAQVAHYPESVATTWSLSFERVEQANPAAAELVRLCAFFAPDDIPEELLQHGALHWPPLLQQAVTDLFAFDQMLEDLLRFSLVKRLAEHRLLSIHRLVQAIQLDAMEPEAQRSWAARVVRAVYAVFPLQPREEVASWPVCLRYLAQAQACDTLIQRYQLQSPEAAEVLERAGSYLREQASYALAEHLYRQALRLREKLFGREHSQVASSLYNLADLQRQQGKYEEAKQLYQRALQIWEQQEGLEDSQIASPLNGLGILYREQRKYGEAEPLYLRALHILERQFGAEHPQVAAALHNLATLYGEQGKYEEAEPLYQRALHILEHQFGAEHPQVAYPLNHLATLYRKQKRYEEAELLYLRALHILEHQFGADHPHVTYPLNGLGSLYREQGKYGEAELCYQRALRIREQQMGSEHPHLISPLSNLAGLYREQGNYGKAESLYERMLCIREQLEAIHPDTANILHEFAMLREAQRNFQQAVSLYHQALVIREQVLGPEHPKTVETRTSYLQMFQAMSRGEVTMNGEMTQAE